MQCQWNSDHDRRCNDADSENERVPDEPPGGSLTEHLERPAAARNPDDQVRERQQQQSNDDARSNDENERGATWCCPAH